MKERSSLINLFWTVMAILAVGATVLGGYVAWKLVHSTTPKIERANMDPDQMLERTLSARQEETARAATDVKVNVVTNTKTENSSFSRNNEKDWFWEDEDEYYDEEEEEDAQLGTGESTEETKKSEQEGEFSYTLEDVSASTQSKPSSTQPKSSTHKSSKRKEIYASYEQGLLQCQQGRMFPCSWKDNTGPLVKQYWLRDFQGPVERIMYTRDGKIVNQTFSRVDGVVIRYQGTFADLYFEDGLLTKVRTFPYENPNLRDWFLISKNGKISACLCGIPTKDCCARSSLYREGGPRRYCDIFPRDADFCPK